MKTEPVRPPLLELDADGVPHAPDFGDVYHSRAGARGQARHVFLAGNGLPQRWAGRDDFTILETGFGLGGNFLATWQAWREDPRRPRRLHYIGIEKHPPTTDQLRQLQARGPANDEGWRRQADALIEAWPSLTPNLHALDLEGGQLRLLLAFFDVRAVLPELIARVDAFYLDGFAPSRNPAMWEPRVIKALGRLAAPGATAATWSVARPLREALATAGFEVHKAPGFEGKREMTVARHAPRTGVRAAPLRLAGARPRRVAIVGAGLAGCAAAEALVALGLECSLIETHPAPAREASGQAAGLYHGVVTPEDGPHARFNRAAALAAARAYAGLPGWRTAGLLRQVDDGGSVDAMRARLQRLGLPPDHVQALDADAAGEQAGLRLERPAWWFPQGGAVSAAEVAADGLRAAGDALRWIGDTRVDRLAHASGAWHLLDAAGRVIERADAVVLANAADALRLLGTDAAACAWPLERSRGQTSSIDLGTWQAAGWPLPRCALAGSGYLLPPRDGRLLFGASSRTVGPDDVDARPQDPEHHHNLQRLGTLLGRPPPAWQSLVQGRVGWRLATDDRLPLVGALPDVQAWPPSGRPADQPRLLPRQPGLYVLTALASRGLSWAPLAARALAAWIAGQPMPLESSLLDAVDAGRHLCRQQRRG